MRPRRGLICLAILVPSPLLLAQAPPSAYTIVEGAPGSTNGSVFTIHRNGTKALLESYHPVLPDGTPAQHSYTFFDIAAGVSHSWDPSIMPPSCDAGRFSGDWGDPFASTAEITAGILKGDLKSSGAETLNGIPTTVYTGVSQGMNVKVWLDTKDGLIIRLSFGAPGASMTTMINVEKASFTPPPASIFALPPACAGVNPPPTPAELMAAETGDDSANWVNANYGPGSKNSCTIVVRVVAARTMAPINRKFQAAIDLTYNPDSPTPPSYVFGVGDDGTSTYAGAGLHEITNQIRNGIVRLENPPAQFMFGINIPTPHRGAGVGLIYRQCFAPVTVLYDIIKDPNNPADGSDYLYAKSGKYATAP